MLSTQSYEELVQKHSVTYVAGGASQNAARGAAVSSNYDTHRITLIIFP